VLAVDAIDGGASCGGFGVSDAALATAAAEAAACLSGDWLVALRVHPALPGRADAGVTGSTSIGKPDFLALSDTPLPPFDPSLSFILSLSLPCFFSAPPAFFAPSAGFFAASAAFFVASGAFFVESATEVVTAAATGVFPPLLTR
jgi:hypothetical protein